MSILIWGATAALWGPTGAIWDPTAFWHWLAGQFHGLRWTEGWGNLATVLVAIAAIVVCVVTLRRNAAQSRQQRRAARADELLTEIAALIGALYERERLADIMAPIADPGAINLQAKADSVATDLVESLSGARAQESYLRASGNTVVIKMLTDDKRIIQLVDSIGAWIASELEDINATLPLADKLRQSQWAAERSQSADELVKDAQVRKIERDEREKGITRNIADLVNYGVENLRRF